MRLLPKYREVIKKYFKEIFKNGEVYLFGSRVDDTKRGGDIDLYLVLKEHSNLFDKKIKFLAKIKRELGEQKIDVVFNTDNTRLIEKEAKKMGNRTLIYKQKLQDNLNESYKHTLRLENAFIALQINYTFPISEISFQKILDSVEHLAYSDQIIYRFSKLQDCMGAKLFKSVLLYEGENVNKPFLDILNQLEAIDIINVDEWFEIRDLRNEIAHDYADSDEVATNILNSIFKLKYELKEILNSIKRLVD